MQSLAKLMFFCRFDIYRKVPKDLTQPTYIGACISVSSMALIAFLFTSELIAFLSPEMLVICDLNFHFLFLKCSSILYSIFLALNLTNSKYFFLQIFRIIFLSSYCDAKLYSQLFMKYHRTLDFEVFFLERASCT